MDDLEIFGVGKDNFYCQSVFAVWQDLVKRGIGGWKLSVEELTKAVLEGSVKQLFEKHCRTLAEIQTVNKHYAAELVRIRFSGVEWEPLCGFQPWFPPRSHRPILPPKYSS
eukprot:gnl/MRDRNA2_/MRDRNA2_289673_c0_seq1.p1 gnl/MRDRNA2_/MRDRNA2_289673_c0~~gnl/MRDRNA2_/MRDRNA2_289673_c0_seq1.p1  ORF type:complete len:122 (-),score=9.39 gnl/MRDRNA2_/MRDRNA2_289673_c0_seq1:64-396(-)